MRSLLAAEQRGELERLARADVLLGFDFDGTLAPIVPVPVDAMPRAETRRLLARVAELYPCVVISGRAAGDVAERLTGIALRGIVGNHGSEVHGIQKHREEVHEQEPEASGRAAVLVRGRVQRWRERLAPLLARLEGVELEDKAYSLAIHYRHAPRREEALGSITHALSELGDARVVGGKEVVNVLPPEASHKGTALERERERLGCDSAFFLGDDVTDEDAFVAQGPRRLWSVRVGESPLSRAEFFLEGQADVDRLLERLIELRRDAPPRSAR